MMDKPMNTAVNDTSSKLKEIVGDNPLMDSVKNEQQEEERRHTFSAIHDLTYAACDLYCKGDLGWDKMLDAFSDAILSLKGKEKELAKDDSEGEED